MQATNVTQRTVTDTLTIGLDADDTHRSAGEIHKGLTLFDCGYRLVASGGETNS